MFLNPNRGRCRAAETRIFHSEVRGSSAKEPLLLARRGEGPVGSVILDIAVAHPVLHVVFRFLRGKKRGNTHRYTFSTNLNAGNNIDTQSDSYEHHGILSRTWCLDSCQKRAGKLKYAFRYMHPVFDMVSRFLKDAENNTDTHVYIYIYMHALLVSRLL